MSSRLLVAVAAALVALAPAAAQSLGRDLYVVQAGDTLFRIARANGLTVDRLRELNALPDEAIQVGQTLRLSTRVAMPDRATAPAPPPGGTPGTPVPSRPTPDTPPATIHTVASGETLFRIAQRYGTSVESIQRLNGLASDRIEIGQRLVVAGTPGRAPVASGPTQPTTRPAVIAADPIVLGGERRPWSITDTAIPADLVHFVDPGETLYSIASSHRLSIRELAAGNALTTAPLEPGTPIYLPRPVEPAIVARRGMPPPDADGLALVYPDVMRGRPTASGEVYDPLAFTASHRTYPLGTILLVTNPTTNRSTFVRVIDRGPVSQSYLLELSAAAATALELDPNEARRVDVRLIP